MTKIDIISGFLGAGKTTLIKKLLSEGFTGEKAVLIENEFGEIGIDGSLLKDYGIEIKEMNSGCICCTISGDFSMALKEVLKLYHPDRIIIEPSGVGKLSDVIKSCGKFLKEGIITLNMCITVLDGTKYKMYLKNFGEFYKDQLMNAKTIILSRTQLMKGEAVESILKDIKKYNPSASIVTTDWEQIKGDKIIALAEDPDKSTFEYELLKGFHKEYIKYGISSGDEAEFHSEVKVSSPVRKKEFKYDKLKITEHHHADEVFSVWGTETVKTYSRNKLNEILNSLKNAEGYILRAKGIIKSEDNNWLQFDYVPGEIIIKEAAADYTGRLCVIGETINKDELSELFEV
jgi:G3E family GTPase